MCKLINKFKSLRDEDIIQDIDLQFVLFLKEQHPGISDDVLLAGGLCSFLYRQGDVCLLLEEYAGGLLFEEDGPKAELSAPDNSSWHHTLIESPVVGRPGDFKPLILDPSGRLYWHKLWHYEQNLAEELIMRGRKVTADSNSELLEDGLSRLFKHNVDKVDWQQIAAANSVRNYLSIISGGPGTGKTSTVIRIIALLLEQAQEHGAQPTIALAAPTGKAAARLQDSIAEARGTIDLSSEIRETIPDSALTLHLLLGARRHSQKFKHHTDNPLPHDIVIVDEVSMVDQAMMSKLLAALREESRLIL